MEGDDAFIDARLLQTTETDTKGYIKAVDKHFSPFIMNAPGFISYTSAATDDPSVFLFYDVFDTEENSIAAYNAAVAGTEDINFGDDEILTRFKGTIT